MRNAGSSSRSRETSPDRGSQEALLGAIMRRQARLSLGVAAVFLVLVLGLPFVNFGAASVAQLPVGGFSATWLFLGLLFYPITWVLSAYFVRASDAVEHEVAEMYGRATGEERRRG
jgi:uncharacterized membrane protein (DUF485 family)